MEELVAFVRETEVRSDVDRLFDELRARLGRMLPNAEILHVGSTAIPGTLTKADLDVQVRVSADDYDRAREILAARYAVNAGGFVADDATSFEDRDTLPPHGVHLTVAGGGCDIQWRFRDALIGSEALRRDYDALKRRFDGGSMAQYRDAKEEFVLRVQRTDAYRSLTQPLKPSAEGAKHSVIDHRK